MAERAAQTQSPHLFYDAFNASPIGIAIENLDGQLLFVNPSFCSMLGFSEEELRSKHCVDFSPPEDAEKDWALFQQLRAGSIDHYQLEKRYFRRHGSLVWGRLSISLLNSHPSPLVIAMVEDITEKKTAEEVQFRHVALVESSEDAIISKNLDAVITSWNVGAERLFGYSESEVLGQPITILIPPELRNEENKILERLRAGGRIEHYETKRVTKAGKKVDVSLTIGPIRDSNRKLVGFSKIAHDITERKRAQELLQETNRALEKQGAALQAGEELLKVFVKNVPAGVAMLDREMRYLQVSDRWCADYGVDASQVLGRSHYEVFPDIPDRWREVHRRALAGETLRCEEDRWDRHCRTTWVRWELRPWKTSMGNIGGVIIFAEEITDRKQAVEALRDSEERLRLAQQAARIGAFEWNIRTGVNTWTPELEVMYGLPPGGFGGTQTAFENLVHPEDRTHVMELVKVSLKTGQPMTGEWRVVWPDGSVHWMGGRWQVLMNESGEPSRVVGVNIDVTDRKLAEESRRRLATIVESSEDAIASVTLDGVIVSWNAGAQRLYGYTEIEAVGKSVTILVPPELPDEENKILERLRSGERIAQYETVRVTKEGKRIDVSLSLSPINDSNGAVVGFAGIAHDITERKQAEEALATMSRKLIEAQERERTRIGRELHDDINQRLALLSIDLAQLKDNPFEVLSRLGKLNKQVDDISSDVQALSHDLQSSKVEHLGIVSGIKSWCKDIAERQRLQIDCSTSVSSVVPFGVGLTLFRVLQEAVQNAMKHSGVKRIDVRLQEDSGEIHLIISDSGRGFDVEAAMHGKGFGLTSMMERVRLIDGAISIDSKRMHGTTIHIRVPLESEHGPRRAAG